MSKREQARREQRIRDLEAQLAESKSLRAAGIDPVTLKNLPHYVHELPAVVPVAPKPRAASAVSLTALEARFNAR